MHWDLGGTKKAVGRVPNEIRAIAVGGAVTERETVGALQAEPGECISGGECIAAKRQSLLRRSLLKRSLLRRSLLSSGLPYRKQGLFSFLNLHPMKLLLQMQLLWMQTSQRRHFPHPIPDTSPVQTKGAN